MSKTVDLLGQQAEYYLNHTCKTIDKKLIHVPGPDVSIASMISQITVFWSSYVLYFLQ